jgi:hypothetical protein
MKSSKMIDCIHRQRQRAAILGASSVVLTIATILYSILNAA